MKSKKACIVILLVFAVILLLLVFYFLNYHFVLFRFYPKEAHIATNSEWYCSNPEIELHSDSSGNIQGKLFVKDNTIPFELFIKGGTAYFYREENGDFLLTGGYSVSRKDEIIIKNIYSVNDEYIDTNINKIVFRQGTKNREHRGRFCVLTS